MNPNPNFTLTCYPFGMPMPGRNGAVSGGEYRYGFNGMEKDDEVKGQGNSYDFGARIYDNRLGRFLSVDPLAKLYTQNSPYAYASNTPIWAEDDGNRPIFKSLADANYIVDDLNRLFRAKWGISNESSNPFEVAKVKTVVFDFKQGKFINGYRYTIVTNDAYNWNTELDNGHAKALFDFINMNRDVYIRIQPYYDKDRLLEDWGGGYTGSPTEIFISSEMKHNYGEHPATTGGKIVAGQDYQAQFWTPGIVFFHEATYHVISNPTRQSANDLRDKYHAPTGAEHVAGGGKPISKEEQKRLDEKKRRPGRKGKRKGAKESF